MQSQSWATKWAHEVAICRLPYRRFFAIFSAERVDRIESSDASMSKWVMSSAARWAAIIASFSLAPLSRVTFRSLTTFAFTLSRSEFTVIYLLSNLLIAELARSAEAGVKRAKPPPRQKLRNCVLTVGAESRCHRRTCLVCSIPQGLPTRAGSLLNRGDMQCA